MRENLVELKSRLDRELRLTLKAMDESLVLQKITMMTPAELESLPEPERVALQSDVLQAIEDAKAGLQSMNRVIFRLQKLWPFDPDNMPSREQACARCGHTFQRHTWRGRDATCGIVGCRCREFMVNLYEEIKAGRKTSEWRNASKYWLRILFQNPIRISMITSSQAVALINKPVDLTSELKVSKVWFTVGFPKGNVPRLETDIKREFYHPASKQLETQVTNVKEVLAGAEKP